MVWQFLRKKKNLGDSLVRVHGALGTAQAITLVLVVIVCVMSVKYLVKTILKDVHCILFLLPGKQWKRVRLRRTLTAESFLPGLVTKHSFVKSVFFFSPQGEKTCRLFNCLSGNSSNVQWTSFEVAFTRYFTGITQTRITKIRVEACNLTEKEPF